MTTTVDVTDNRTIPNDQDVVLVVSLMDSEGRLVCREVLTWRDSCWVNGVENAIDRVLNAKEYLPPPEGEGYPTLRIEAPQLTAEELWYVAVNQRIRGNVFGGPVRWERLWHCPPSREEIAQFAHQIRLFPYNRHTVRRYD